MNNPVNIAVIIPVYKQLQLLRRCLDSVLWQLEPGDHVVIVGEHEEAEAFKSLRESRQVTLQTMHPPRAGIAAARNAGVKSAIRNPQSAINWVKFLDADDVLAPFALSTFRKLAGDKDFLPYLQVVVGSQIKVVDGEMVHTSGPDLGKIKKQNPFLPSMAFVRRSALEAVDGFDVRLHFEEDWDLWLRLLRKYTISAFATVKWPTCYYTIDQAERAQKVRGDGKKHGEGCEVTIDGETMDVRAYLAREYGVRV